MTRDSSEPEFLIGVSLKMYFSHARTVEWARAVGDICREHEATTGGTTEVFVLPTFPSLPAVLDIDAPWGVGAQDLASADEGAFTGEVSGAELAEIGCRFVEVGHAERRTLFGETEEVVAAKLDAAVRNGLVPVLCIGEHERMPASDALAECVEQVRSALAVAREKSHRGRIVVAYEPHWAIGAPAPASADHIRDVCRDLPAALAGDAVIERLDVLYGGSAGPGLLGQISDAVDGLFLGRFAHDPDAVRAILDETVALSTTAR
ncbi:triose-phosphate isomerase family protein [Marisediminicola sp. LYQ134]|uniref:triose-phosphate isomerase family protein n=1 Tax=unclassified Marisediminicola TaxID=2618316 RepID=UPI0039838732